MPVSGLWRSTQLRKVARKRRDRAGWLVDRHARAKALDVVDAATAISTREELLMNASCESR